MRAQLVPLEGGTAIDIVKDMTVVGRKQECDVRLDHKSVSKFHCVIVKTDGLLLLRDLGSTNGTRVNGLRVRRAALLPNDQLFIAHFKFRVHLGPDLPPAAAVSEHTQQLDADDVADLLKRVSLQVPEAAAGPGLVSGDVRANPLPDIYPEDKPAS